MGNSPSLADANANITEAINFIHDANELKQQAIELEIKAGTEEQWLDLDDNQVSDLREEADTLFREAARKTQMAEALAPLRRADATRKVRIRNAMAAERRMAESKMELKTAMEAHLMEQQTSLIAEVSGGRPEKEIVKSILRQCKTYNKKRIPKEIFEQAQFEQLHTLVLKLQYDNDNDVKREAKNLIDSCFPKNNKIILLNGGGSSPVSEAVFARIREDLGPRVERRCRAYAMKYS